MLPRLYDIVFGQDEFDKIKIDVRFELISEVIDKIKISQLEDFELLEACVYKIKDQLRVKSSNLNRIIRDPAKKLTKKQVLYIINTLDKIKYDFLEEAFIAMGKTFPKQRTTEEKLERTLELKSKGLKNLENSDEQKEIIEDGGNKLNDSNSFKDNFYQKITQNTNDKLEELLLYLKDSLSSHFCEFKLVSGKIPYILLNFNQEVDLVYVSKLSSIFYESLALDGTNIIIENTRVLIIPRFVNDNLFSLPKINSDLDFIYDKLTKNKKTFEVEKDLKDKNYNSNILESEAKTKSFDSDYFEIERKKQEFNSNKQKEDSLDSLINGIVHKKDEIHPPVRDDEKKSDDVILEKDDSIELEKKTQEELYEEKRKREVKIEKTAFVDREKHIVYKDDMIQAFLDEESKVVGSISLNLLSGNTLNDATQEELTYISLFSKVFSSVVFDSLQAHGTNIFWDFNLNEIRIVPRFQNDNLNLTWNNLDNSDEFNEQIKNSLLERMMREIPNDSNKNEEQELKEEKLTDDELKLKAQHLLNSLRKIP